MSDVPRKPTPPPFPGAWPAHKPEQHTTPSALTADIVQRFATQLGEVSRELAAERDARLKERENGFSVLKLHVPLIMVFTMFVVMAGTFVGGGLFVYVTRVHMSDANIHLDHEKVLNGGGLVYKNDLKAEIASARSDAEAGDRRSYRALNDTVCILDKQKQVKCNFKNPVFEPLYPGATSVGEGTH